MLTNRDLEVMTFIEAYVLKTDFYPSIQEIAEGMDIKSTSTVHTHMKKLEDEGLLVRKSDNSPTYRLINLRFRVTHIPKKVGGINE